MLALSYQILTDNVAMPMKRNMDPFAIRNALLGTILLDVAFARHTVVRESLKRWLRGKVAILMRRCTGNSVTQNVEKATIPLDAAYALTTLKEELTGHSICRHQEGNNSLEKSRDYTNKRLNAYLSLMETSFGLCSVTVF